MSAYSDLPLKQRRFVDELIADPKSNATAAATRAGYSPKRPDVAAAKLMAQPRVAQAVAERQGALAAKAGVSKEWVLQKLLQVVERCMQEEAVLDRKGKPTGEFQFDSAGANRALELLARHLGMFPKESGGNTFNLNAFDPRSIPAVTALFERLAALGASGGAAPADQGGSVLLAALRHGEEGRAALMAPEPDQGRGDGT